MKKVFRTIKDVNGTNIQNGDFVVVGGFIEYKYQLSFGIVGHIPKNKISANKRIINDGLFYLVYLNGQTIRKTLHHSRSILKIDIDSINSLTSLQKSIYKDIKKDLLEGKSLKYAMNNEKLTLMNL